MKDFSARHLLVSPWWARTVRRFARLRSGACLPALLLLLLALGVRAQQRPAPMFFQDDAAARKAAAGSPLAAAVRHSRPLTLNTPGLRAALAAAPLEGKSGASPLVLALPLPDGTTGRFAVVEASVMAPALAAQFPEIKTYSGVGLDDPAATVRLDLTPRGFHAQVLTADGNSFYIDPVGPAGAPQYLSFYRRDMDRAAGPVPTCGFAPTPAELKASAARVAAYQSGAAARGAQASGAQLRTYRLALANTAEYALAKGNTLAGVMAGKVATLNRVVGVYEKELAVRLVLVANNNVLNFLSGTGPQPPTPYTNSAPETMLGQNQSNLDALIGTANYDIGHVFGTGSGGVAYLGVVCGARKAQGVTGRPGPVGDAFDIDFVAHEMGHQFGGNHTFNNNSSGSCDRNREPSTAWEPGSGSTIMAYAGICGSANDLQRNSDAIFHTGSHDEIRAFVSRTACGTTTATGNTAPLVTAPANRTLPVNTPFKLTAAATDAEKDPLTYLWEELDLGPAQSPTDAQVPNVNVPLFRSFVPGASPTRYFPRLSDLVKNTAVLGERLPAFTRVMTFRCTARDQHNGPAGVIGGVDYSPLVTLNVTGAAGPFVVTSPNTAVSWAGNTTQTVVWNVAGTAANGVNCALVNIRLSTDGGLTYPTLLLANTANDGTQTIKVPSSPTTAARIMVEAADNYFFDISNVNFTITAPAPCAAPTGLAVSQITQSGASVSFAPSAGATAYTVTTVPATTARTVAAGPVALTGLAAGTAYTVNLVSNCAIGAVSTMATAGFTTAPPPFCAAPTGLAVGSITATSASVSFAASAGAGGYTVTTVPATTTRTVTASPVALTGLTGGTAYTVNLVSNCTAGGTGAATAGFTTAPPPFCAAPTGLAVGSITATSASVSFAASAGAGGYTVTTVPATTTRTVTASPIALTGLSAGTAYTVRVASNCTAGGTGAATAGFITPPANDDCANAITLTSATTCQPVAGTVLGATQSLLGVNCTKGVGKANDVWYRFTATSATHTVTVASIFDGVLVLYTGTCDSRVNVGCRDVSGGGETLTLTSLTAGKVYLVRYYAFTSTSTTPPPTYPDFSICVSGPVAAPPAAKTSPAAELSELPAAGLDLFPNPTATAVTVAGAAPGATVRVFDSLGRVVLTADADATGHATLRWPAASLAAGVYLVRSGRASARLSVAP